MTLKKKRGTDTQKQIETTKTQIDSIDCFVIISTPSLSTSKNPSMAVENPDNDSDNDLKNKNKLRYCDTVDGR